MSCHTDGGIAPFSMTDVDFTSGAPDWAPLAAHAVETRAMPPWQASPDCHPIAHAQRLADEEVAVFTAWAEAGYPEGDPADFVALVADAVPDPGPADVALDAGVDYTPATIVSDDYHCLPVGDVFEADTLLRAIEVRPGQRSVVHHAIAYYVGAEALPSVEAADAAEPGPGYTCYGGPVPGSGGADHLHAWVPGAAPEVLPEGDARRLPAGGRIVLQMHYNTLSVPDGASPPADRTSVALWAFEGEPLGIVATVALPHTDIPIPAGRAEVTHTRDFAFGQAAMVVGMAGHMHQLGTSLRVDVVHPGGGEDCLLDLEDWDFAWQRTYDFPEGQAYALAADDVVRLTCVYDNSDANQPIVDGVRQAPRDVRWGEGTLDEMCLAYALVRYGGALGGAEGCGPFEGCFSACPEGDGACLSTCLTGALTECGQCGLKAVASCGVLSCGAEGLALKACVEGCGDNQLACLVGDCADVFEAYLGCQDPHVRDGSCDSFLETCGVTFGAP